MRRTILLTATLSLVAAQPLLAGTFERARIAPELGLDALTRGVTREQLGRDLFAEPYATVTLGTLDVYAVFPYVESRTFQIVSDPRWNRLIVGEQGHAPRAWDGATTALGALADPRGLAVDENGRVFVADAGNDRVVVLQSSTEFGTLTLAPLYAVAGLHDPHGVAVADGGTPFVPGDDVLYVADTGRNRIVAFALGATGARPIAELGELGSGAGRFAGPMAVATGPAAGGARDVFVADAHTRRIVRLRHDARGLRWDAEATHDADVLTSLETDRWGNLYAAAPNRGVVRKFNRDLEAVADLRSDLARPRGFHVPYLNVNDHRTGSVTRVGQPSALTVDQWADATGLRLWTLGADVNGLAVTGGDAPEARFTLTDRAAVSLEIVDGADGRLLASRPAGTFDAGSRILALTADDLGAAAGANQPLVRVAAASSYPGGATARAQAPLDGVAAAGGVTRPMSLGNHPNPVRDRTAISFVLPAGAADDAELHIFDASGRQVRAFTQRFTAGRNDVLWDGTDDRGRRLAGGIYFYRLRVGAREFGHRMVLVR